MKTMKRLISFVITAAASALLAACGAGATAGPTINAVDPNYGKLQFAVGTANLYGGTGNATTGLNVVSTMRQPNGHSAYGVDAPTITGPFVFTVGAAPANQTLSDPYNTVVNNGPSLMEVGGSSPSIGATSQTVHPGTPACDGIGSVPNGFATCPAGVSPNASTFGQAGGIFAMGIAPYNSVASTGQSYSYAPFAQPMYETTSNPQFVPWGGPPAFDPDGNGMGTRDGLIVTDVDSFGDPYFLGVGEGISIFENVTPNTTSPYTMSVSIMFNSNGQNQTITKTAQANLTSATLLPAIAAPQVFPDGTGGATFTIAAANFPVNVTEALVQIVDYGPGGGPLHPQGTGGFTTPNCQGARGTSFAPTYYTFEFTATGIGTLGALHGPNNLANGPGSLTPTPSICTAAQNNAALGGSNPGDNITVQIIGFDYPDYEAAVGLLGQNVPQSPAITGANGQADITVSAPIEEDYPGYNPQPALRIHRSMKPHAPIRHRM
jgi:hypothetical protein